MSDEHNHLHLISLPALSEDERDDASFRMRDRLWSAIADLFDRYEEEHGLTYALLGRRIGRTRSQVQRWLDAPSNMTLLSAGLLIEGLDADPEVRLCPRQEGPRGNRAHPCEEAQAQLYYQTFSEGQPVDLSNCDLEDVGQELPTGNYSTVENDEIRHKYHEDA